MKKTTASTSRKNTMTRLLLDTNILLDATLKREGLWEASAAILSLPDFHRDCELFIPAHAIPTFIYICRRNRIPEKEACRIVAGLLHYASVGALDEKAILRGLGFGFLDTEDAFVAAIAENLHADYIVTRNAKDFKGSPVPPISPEEYLQQQQS